MSCHELNEQNEAGDDKDEEYEEENKMPEYVVEEFMQFENQHKQKIYKNQKLCIWETKSI